MHLQVRNKIIDESIYNILLQVKSELKNGKLKDIVNKGANVVITCPIHSDGHENKPACQVYCGDSDKVNYGTAHCFACGYKADLPQLISDCFDEKGRDFGEEWLIERFGDIALYKGIDIESPIILNQDNNNYMDPKILEKYRFYHQYMWDRKLTKEIVDKFDIGYDKETKSITFPIWDENNNLVMITKRSVIDKHFYIDENVEKPVYLYNFIKSQNITTVYLCESQINALTLWGWGYPAIALIGTGSSHQYEILKKSGIRNYILCFDGDKAGDNGIKRFIKNMPNDIFISIKQIPRNKDVNDLSKDAFEKLPMI